jgi:predicted RNA methylase
MDIYFPKVKDIDLTNLKISNIGKYSVSKPKDASVINNIISSYFPLNMKLTITDACANNGGNTIHFGLKFYKVNSIEIDKDEFDILTHNVKIYKLKNIKLIHDDYLKQMYNLKQDVLFIDAPWGGFQYYKKKNLDLYLGNENIIDIIKKLYEKKLYKLAIIKVPKNFNFNSLFNCIDIKFDVYCLNKFIIIGIYVK